MTQKVNLSIKSLYQKWNPLTIAKEIFGLL